MNPEQGVVALSILTVASAAINVYVGLRLAALQSKLKADSAKLEMSLVKQFVSWKDDVLAAINGKYVSAALIAEIRSSIGREISTITARLDHLDDRCEKRHSHCPDGCQGN